MISLQEYFKIDDTEKVEFGIDELKFINKNILQFETFLNTNFVLRNPKKINTPVTPTDITYEEIIDYVIKFLLENKLFNNVITFGLKKNYQNDTTKLVCSRTPNKQVKALKTIHWRMLYNIIGPSKFIDFLINCSVFQLEGKKWQQIIGNRANKPTSPPPWSLMNSEGNSKDYVSMKPFLYKSYTKFGTFTSLLRNGGINELRQIIYDTQSVELTKVQKKRIDAQLSGLLKNCSKQINYTHMLNNVCPISFPTDSTTSHLDAKTSKKLVTKFVILMVEKLVPITMFGSKHNKSRIFASISDLINLSLNGVIYLNDILLKIRTKDVKYLYFGNSPSHQNQARFLFKNFMIWLFAIFVPKIIKTFFYCSEVSASPSVVYYRQDVWKTITAPFISQYFSSYLMENVVCRNHSSYTLSNFNHNRMRVVPKRAVGEFRIISVPYKGVDEEEHIAYRINRMKVTVPIQSILNYIRHKRKTDFEKIRSPFQIANKLYNFKKGLLDKYGTLPELYFMKFDVASCYDSIPRKKVMSVLKNLLKRETNFYVSSYTTHNPKDGRLKIKHLVNEDRKKGGDKVRIDNNQNFFFTTQSLLDAVEFEVFKTVLWVDDRCFLRKDGIFQGSGYSPLLVDILYDDMLQHYKQFKCPSNHYNMIIRIADDFLIISTDQQQIQDIKKLAVSGFGEYNASVKQEKIVVTTSQITPSASSNTILQFCGLDIDIKNLEIWKSKESLNVPIIHNTSAIRAYTQVVDMFRLRLEYRTLNGELNSLKTIENQIKILMDNISSIFIEAFKNKIVHTEAFFEFIDNIMVLLCEYSFNMTIADTKYRKRAKKILVEEFIRQLKRQKPKYMEILSRLETIR